MQEGKYIILYVDEFDRDVWAGYMNVLGLSEREAKVKILIRDCIAMNDEEVDR